MKIVNIDKGNGKRRKIYVPNGREKIILRHMIGSINKKVRKEQVEGVIHGFMPHRSVVSNAEQHCGHAYTLSFDIENFFDSITEDKLGTKLTKEEKALVLVDGAVRQGLPTSPSISNLIGIGIDRAIIGWRDKKKIQFVYTRYADDLCFSFDDPTIIGLLKSVVPSIVGRLGFRLNKKKTKLQEAKQGRRIITGISVDNGLHPTRKTMRKLRAALHQKNIPSARGLLEWSKCKLPKSKDLSIQCETELESLRAIWKFRSIRLKLVPEKGPDIHLLNDVFITSDPIYILGCSTYTTGWTSCMKQPGGNYRKGCNFWIYLKGTRLAARLHSSTKEFNGVERRVMGARCWVHELRNGVKVYDRMFGNFQDIDILERELITAGYISIFNARQKFSGEKVIGNVPKAIAKPYLDSLRKIDAIHEKKKVIILKI